MGKPQKRWIVFLLLFTAAAFRVSVAHFLPNDAPDDGRAYAQLARNLLERHVYSLASEPPYKPTLVRLPGYSLFVAAVYALFGHTNNTAVRIAQALLDAAGCGLVALLAFYWEPDERRKWMTSIAALALAAVCPFTTIYVATILTESETTLLAVAMCLAATLAFKAATSRESLAWWSATGILAGTAVLLRPDSGLFAAAIGLTLVISSAWQFWSAPMWSAPAEKTIFHFSVDICHFPFPAMSNDKCQMINDKWKSPLRFIGGTFAAGALFSLAFVLVLLPWTIRNARVFHLFQPLAPTHGEMPGDFVPRGYQMWLRTWLDDARYIDATQWSLDQNPITLDQIPAGVFDSSEERNRVAALLNQYNHPPGGQQANASASPEPTPAAPDGSPHEVSIDRGQADAGQEAFNENSEGESDAEDNETDEAADAEPEEPGSVEMTPEIDSGFAEIARERIARHPLRYYVWLPAKRAAALWFDTHSQYWPFEGELFPLDDLDHQIHQHIWLPLFAALTWIYTLLGLAGAWLLWRGRQFAARRWLLLVALLIFLRLGFFSTMENPEPRYVVEFFPFLAALGGIAIARIPGFSSHG